MDKKRNKIHENLMLTKINNHMHILYNINSYNKYKYNIPYNWPAFLAASYWNSGY